jgi:hypothetical protein
VTLAEGAWSQHYRLSPEDNVGLIKPFTPTEVKETAFEMREDSAPGPDGFGVSFYKKHWGVIQRELMAMVNDFYLDKLDIDKLNYGVITLLPKVSDANEVKQYRPICLLNVSFKIFTRLLTKRLSLLANKLISPKQTTFIKGRYIVDGAVMLHEIVHELHRKRCRV